MNAIRKMTNDEARAVLVGDETRAIDLEQLEAARAKIAEDETRTAVAAYDCLVKGEDEAARAKRVENESRAADAAYERSVKRVSFAPVATDKVEKPARLHGGDRRGLAGNQQPVKLTGQIGGAQ